MEQYIGGRHAVLEALRSGRALHKIYVADSPGTSGLAALTAEAKQAGVPVQRVDKRKLDQLAPGVRHQGVVAQTAAYGYAELDDILRAAADSGEAPFLVVLDEIEDPHNLGSILRTAECAGVHGVVIPKRRSVGLTATVAKTSAGAVEHVPVARVTNIAQTIERLKREGIWTVAAVGGAERTIHDIDLTVPVALVIGNEHKGIGRLVRETCDLEAGIPMYGRIASLNASVAAGIMMYEAVRQRRLR
jgi:rRNA methylase, putative, group 3